MSATQTQTQMQTPQTVLVHMCRDSRHGFFVSNGVLTIHLDRSDPATRLAKLVFMSDDDVSARARLGLTKAHPDRAWAVAAMDAFVDTFMCMEDDGMADKFGSWAVDNQAKLRAANAAGGVLVKCMDADDWTRAAVAASAEPDLELLDALRAYKDGR